ncbi:DUF1289 domain-containing protein [Hyphomicrobiales bacterium]|jgi:uncharacterized protein|nr:DUF1289 domain-containing protein [Rhodobiaceae bacterium]MBT5640912.1 DUF1289 domain-containing protein [Rhodobiaceae bacterium]MBT6222879.1 DUF1289 domain-containing protein [Rhodobiaceae bacterium]MDB4128030.1 DUF1289 domain-containing protein [Hyphomicrobiales bacterium]|tara:strand:- start:51 stop:323 length:273 start_codon:yes stop_codon:yes gene_type:complete
MNKVDICSPCINVCKIDPLTSYCYGCGRTSEEIKLWKDEHITNEWKEENIRVSSDRMTGWQLESFKKSYANKILTGKSLIKELKEQRYKD